MILSATSVWLLSHSESLLLAAISRLNSSARHLQTADTEIELREEVLRLETQEGDLNRLADERRQVIEQLSSQVENHRQEIHALEKRAQWADKLIEQHAVFPIKKVHCALWNLDKLSADEPFFDVAFQFRYDGVLRLVIGDSPPSGKLSLDGEEFQQDPEITTISGEALPFDHTGPIETVLRLRQNLTAARATRLKSRLGLENEEMRSKEREVEFYVNRLELQYRIQSAIDDRVFRAGSFFGDYLEAKYRVGD
jgi:hypothetical protein